MATDPLHEVNVNLSIGKATRFCQQQFRKLSSSFRDVSDTQAANLISNQYDRLSLWAQDVRALNGGLDAQLQRSSSLQSCTRALLSELSQELNDSDAPIESLIEEIQDIIDNLFSLEPALQNPAPLDEPDNEIHDLSEIVTNLHLAQLSPAKTNLKVVYEAIRPTSKKSDVDIIAFANIHGDSSWQCVGHPTVSKPPISWISPLLPDAMRNNDVYARVISGTYDLRSEMATERPSLENIANDFVKAINQVRLRDPDRQLCFIGDRIGGILVKYVVQILIKEGLSVHMELKPVSGCIFFGVPRDLHDMLYLCQLIHDEYSSTHKESQWTEMLGSPSVHARFAILLDRYQIPIISYLESREERNDAFNTLPKYPTLPVALPDTSIVESTQWDTPCEEVFRHFPDGEESVLLLAHQIAVLVEHSRQETEVHVEMGFALAIDRRQGRQIGREDPFAMLVAYNTVILINDSLTVNGEIWTTMQDLVRDLVDVVTNYDTEDVDLQLYNQEIQSYNVSDGMQAARLLARTTPRGYEWDPVLQIQRYLQKYRTAPSSKTPDGAVKPIDMIVLTGGSSEASRRGPQVLRDLIEAGISESGFGRGVVHIQVVNIVAQDKSQEGIVDGSYWNSVDVAYAKLIDPIAKVAPTFMLNTPYSSDSRIVRRVLLGPITTRFRETHIDPASTFVGVDGSVLGVDSEFESSLDDGTNIWSAKGKYATGASSMTSGEYEVEHDPSQFEPFNPGSTLLQSVGYLTPPTGVEMADPKSPSYGEMPKTAAYLQRLMDAVPDVILTTQRDVDSVPEKPPLIRIESTPVSRQSAHGTVEMEAEDLSKPDYDRTRAGISTSAGSFDSVDDSSSTLKITDPYLAGGSPGPIGDSRTRYPPDRGSEAWLRRHDIPNPHSSIGLQPDLPITSETSSLGARGLPRADAFSGYNPYPILNTDPPVTAPRIQKHPATFQCPLCPKRFTRAYNLRSHLRTHTDERPFVCTVCGKAFARQHDRKRHEALHSGEKKFVCRGVLASSPTQTWGCGRRFARADALGRHFRSEAGRLCIRPLLEEEKRERKRQGQTSVSEGIPDQSQQPSSTFTEESSSAAAPATLPAALLAQYPVLQNLDWGAIEFKDDPREMSDVSAGSNNDEPYEFNSDAEYY